MESLQIQPFLYLQKITLCQYNKGAIAVIWPSKKALTGYRFTVLTNIFDRNHGHIMFLGKCTDLR